MVNCFFLFSIYSQLNEGTLFSVDFFTHQSSGLPYTVNIRIDLTITMFFLLQSENWWYCSDRFLPSASRKVGLAAGSNPARRGQPQPAHDRPPRAFVQHVLNTALPNTCWRPFEKQIRAQAFSPYALWQMNS